MPVCVCPCPCASLPCRPPAADPASRPPLPCLSPLQSRQQPARRSKMSGQTLTDRIAAAQYSVTGSAVARAVCKATTHEVMGPKKKHLDCEHPFFVSPAGKGPGLRSLPAGHVSGPLSRLVTLALIQLAKHEGDGKSPGEDELLLHFFSYCIILLFRPFFFLMTSCLLSRKTVERVPYGAGAWEEGRESDVGQNGHALVTAYSVRIKLGWDIHT